MSQRSQEALVLANHVRLTRSQLRHRIERGELSAAAVIADPPQEARTWPVSAMLMAQPRWGRRRCLKFLWHNRISETRLVGELTERQRRLLSDQLRGVTR